VLQQVDAPIVASIDIRGPNYGFHVEAQWPPRIDGPLATPDVTLIPPVKVLGVTIDHAVPLSTPIQDQ
jgi:hypothetical protein